MAASVQVTLSGLLRLTVLQFPHLSNGVIKYPQHTDERRMEGTRSGTLPSSPGRTGSPQGVLARRAIFTPVPPRS